MMDLVVDYWRMGQRIKYFRKQKKLTQAEICKSIGLSCSFYGHIERGSRIPSVDTVVRIAKALEVPIDVLLLESSGIVTSRDSQMVIKPLLDGMMRSLTKHIDEWFINL